MRLSEIPLNGVIFNTMKPKNNVYIAGKIEGEILRRVVDALNELDQVVYPNGRNAEGCPIVKLFNQCLNDPQMLSSVYAIRMQTRRFFWNHAWNHNKI